MSQLTIKAYLHMGGINPKTFDNGKQKKDFIISWKDKDRDKQLVLTAWNKTIEEMEDAVGTGERTFHFEVTSNKSGNNWFTSAKVWRCHEVFKFSYINSLLWRVYSIYNRYELTRNLNMVCS